MKIGDKILVFDYKLWNGKDEGDNSQFFKPATILNIYTYYPAGELADVKFHHDNRISFGHFTNVMKEYK